MSSHLPSPIRRALLSTAAALILSSAPGAWASPVTYSFAPGTEIAFSNGDTEALQGTISVDPTITPNTVFYHPDITLTGAAPEAGHYTAIDPSNVVFARFFQASRAPALFSLLDLTIVFDTGLGLLPTTASITSIDIAEVFCTATENTPVGVECISSTFADVTGTVIEGGSVAVADATDPPAVPEPASLALFSVGLVGLAVSRRRAVIPA